MGRIDVLAREFLNDNEVFADICNLLFHGGRGVVTPGSLVDLSPEETVRFAAGADGVGGGHGRVRGQRAGERTFSIASMRARERALRSTSPKRAGSSPGKRSARSSAKDMPWLANWRFCRQ